MALPGVYANLAEEAKDLKDPQEQLAYEEGHDADLPTNLAASVAAADPSSDAEKAAYADEQHRSAGGSTKEDEDAAADPNEVWWDEPADRDPQNPMNWPSWKKWSQIAVLSYITFITPLASSIFAPAVPDVMKDFGSNSDTLATFVVSVYLLGFALGPLVLAPLSEVYGRYWVYTTNNLLFTLFAIACALSKNLNQLIAFRFLNGIAGVAPLTIGAGSIADMIPVEGRGKAMAVWAMGPLVGPVIGPLGGGFLSQAKGWRWVFWLLAILVRFPRHHKYSTNELQDGFGTIISFLFIDETYAPVLLAKKTKRLRKETGNQELRSRLESKVDKKTTFLIAIVRPTKMLLFSPIVTAICVYISVAYGILYLLFTTFTYVFTETYGFGPGEVGLTFIPLGIGMFLALFIIGFLTDRIVRAKQAKGEEVKPEDRIPVYLILIAGLCLPVGLFIYGWTAKAHTHWIAPLIGTMIVGFGLLIVMVSTTGCQFDN
jgi:multidrug resistance protein